MPDTSIPRAFSTRDELISAGSTLLEEGGLENLSLRKIALQAGVSHGAPRHYFPTFNSLLAAIVKQRLMELNKSLEICFHEKPASRALESAAREYFAFAHSFPQTFALMTRHDILEASGENIRRLTGSWTRALEDLLQEAKPTSDGTDALLLWASVHGLAQLSIHDATVPAFHESPDFEEALHRLIERAVS